MKVAKPGSETFKFTLGAFMLAVLVVILLLRFEISNDITHFLPDPKSEGAKLSSQLSQSELSRTMALAIGNASKRKLSLSKVSRDFEAALRAEPVVKKQLALLQGGPAQGTERALWELYEPKRLAFFAPNAKVAAARLSDAALSDAALRLRHELASPMSTLVSRVAPRDPFLILPNLFRQMEQKQGVALKLHEGRFINTSHDTALLFLQSKASAFDANAQEPLLRGIRRAFAKVNARYHDALRLEQSGINRFTVRAARAIEADIKRVSVFSVLLLAALLFLLFRSFRFVALAVIPLAAGLLAGGVAVLLVFDRLHGVTLAFGASLIGVCIDYVVHLYCHHVIVAPKLGPRASLRTIGPALFTGMATTLIGFLALAASSLAGLREVALFSSAGIVSAFATTWLMVPALMPTMPAAVPARKRFVSWVNSVLVLLRLRRPCLWFVFVLVLIFIALYLPRARWSNSFAEVGRLDPTLLQEDERVRALTQVEQGRFAVAVGQSEAEALTVNEQVHALLSEAVNQGELSSYRSLAPLLPSPQTQREVALVLHQAPQLKERMVNIFKGHGFTEDAFTPFFELLARPPAQPLSFADLLGSPLAPLVQPFRLELDSSVAFVTFLHGIRDDVGLQTRFALLKNASFVRQSELMQQSQHAYQSHTLQLLGLGLLAVLLFLALRYRNLRRTVASFLPSLLAAGTTVSVLTLVGVGLDLVTLTALLFVVSIGVDYGVFLVDANRNGDALQLTAAFSGILLACVSTVAGFGVLAFSEHPVLSSLGLTAAVGIGSSLFLAPCTLLLIQPETKLPESNP